MKEEGTTVELYELPPSIRRADSQHRGRHLVANETIAKGRLLFCERPMVYMQSTGNVHAGVLVCHYCMAFCGTPQMALDIAADPSCLPAITATKSAGDDDDDTGNCNPSSLLPCQHCCGHVYCSQECREDDWKWGGHEQLCTGRIGEDEHSQQAEKNDASPDNEEESAHLKHPLLQFGHHAITTNEIFIIVAAWIARIRLHNLSYPESSSGHPYTDFSMNPWWEVACLPYINDPGGFAKAHELDKSLRDLCRDSHAFLQQAWNITTAGNSTNDDWLTPLGVSKLVGSLEQNCMGIRRKHPVRHSVMMDSDLRKTHHAKLIKCLERGGMIGDGDGGDCETDEDNENDAEELPSTEEITSSEVNENKVEPSPLLNTDEEWDYSVDDIAEFLAGLPPPVQEGTDDAWDEIFTPLDGTALFSIACKMNHACEPNVILLYKARGWGRDYPLVAYCVALRDIQEGEELTISYIDSDGDYKERQEALANYGFECGCAKCERDKNSRTTLSSNNMGDTENDDDDADDLFGDSDNEDDPFGESDGDEDDASENEDSVTGEAKLEAVAERLESVLNKSMYATIPVQILASAASFVVQTIAGISNDLSVKVDEEKEDKKHALVNQLLDQCKGAVQKRDFSMSRLVGVELEGVLYKSLREHGSWLNPVYQRAYLSACVTSAIGFAQDCSFLTAMKFLDKTVILGGVSAKDQIKEMYKYIEIHAHQMASAPCPPSVDGIIPDYKNGSSADLILEALPTPIANPVEEATLKLTSDSVQQSLKQRSLPLVFRGFSENWPATREWRNLNQLVHKYGHRLVPIEVGSMYGGTMKELMVSFRSFVSSYLEPSVQHRIWSLEDAKNEAKKVAYLAQHHLLDQISGLYNQVDRSPYGIVPTHVNVWMGTGGTRTPLHFDSYDNLLVQVVGVKYVRLYGPEWTPKLYVKGKDGTYDSGYASQGNMSSIECECEDYSKFPLAEEATYTEVVLFPGDCLFIPCRHWHYVRSLTTSVSVNYWF